MLPPFFHFNSIGLLAAKLYEKKQGRFIKWQKVPRF